MSPVRAVLRGVGRLFKRMGSFSSSPKILNEDTQDNEVDLPEGLTREDLLALCRKQLEGTPHLLKRRFRNDFSALYHKYDLYYPPIIDQAGIRVMQWNVLSQTLCYPFIKGNGLTSPHLAFSSLMGSIVLLTALGLNNDNFACCPPDALNWERRRNLIAQEIIRYSPDIVCLQEVDHFNYLKRTLGSQGYVGHFFPKPDSPCLYINDNNGPDGCAIFYLANKFQLIKTEARVLEVWKVQSNQVALLANLRNNYTGSELCVVSTHLKARKGALLAALRNEQGRDLLEFTLRHNGNRPVVLCGDFNAEPSEPVYNTLTTDVGVRLGSAYATQGCEPPYTTWKVRQEGEVCHTIDYIFYSKNKLRVEDTLEFPTGEEMGRDRVPSFSYPSDHFSLVCDIYPQSITSPL